MPYVKHSLLVFSFLLFAFGSSAQYLKEYSDENTKVYSYNFEQITKFLEPEDDKIYVVNFWATWCGPCVKELPYFEELLEKQEKNGLEVILISLDFPKKIESKLLPFLAKHSLKSKVIILDEVNPNDWIDKVDPTWSGALPATLIYKGDKRKFLEQSFYSYDELLEEIKEFQS